MSRIATVGKRVVPPPLRAPAKRLQWRLMGESGRRREVARRLRSQARVCERFRSPLYASLLGESASDVEQGGPCWQVLAGTKTTAVGADDALPLRFMAAVHRVALEGRAPALAEALPSTSGAGSDAETWLVFRETVAELSEELQDELAHSEAVQTNEVTRCTVLGPGFLTVARETALPLRVLEVGASAGLNLRWDHYRYEVSGSSFGDPDSPVHLGSEVVEGQPVLDVRAVVAERRGCDLEPIDPCSEDGQLALLSYVWADQPKRADLLRGAFEVAARVPATVDRADAAVWLEVQLAELPAGVATVVFHSFVMQYLTEEARAAFLRTLERAAAAATPVRPLAWLRMEWGGELAETRLTTWPGGGERLLARSTHIGWDARWLDS